MKFYTNDLSSPGRTAWSIAQYLKIDIEKVVLNLVNKEHKSEEYLQKNPHGKIPTL